MGITMAHTSLKVENLEESKRFYIDILGLEHIEDTANEKYYFSLIKAGAGIIELLESRTSLYEKKATGPIDHIAFWVDDLTKCLERLKAFEIKFLLKEPIEALGSSIFFVEGPSGERVELMEKL